ncbi:hypothetical protein BDN72DRAFT_759802 [Pluteus cervinus]|uniref:Uncharacterized protein n=1 Tax=Pluteus cervinus TaxID=181527 RepID=A0ACD3B8M5_9AGAR|nr:hypothetical protein BDN72DRAFT_759802 [Pluteus cervinus]
MTVSVDDLVSSLSTSHIGQEALELAALQAQLSQTLFGQAIPSTPAGRHPISRRPSRSQPCTTPLGRTPSSSFSFGQMSDVQWHINTTSFRTTDERFHEKEEMDDERMVEDLLIPSSPITPNATANPTSPHFAFPQTQNSTSIKQAPHTFVSMQQQQQTQESLFTTTDPFYIAQAQALQAYGTSPQSVFTQTGLPSQHSPFMAQQQQQQSQASPHGMNFSPSSIPFDNTVFMTAYSH